MGLGLLALVALVVLAGSATAQTPVVSAQNQLLSGDLSAYHADPVLKVRLTAGATAVSFINIFAQNAAAVPGWAIDQNLTNQSALVLPATWSVSHVTATNISFRSTGSLAAGASAEFNIALETVPTTATATTASEAMPDGWRFCITADCTAGTLAFTGTVSRRPVGILNLVVDSPQGAKDQVVSPGQSVQFSVVVRNHAAAQVTLTSLTINGAAIHSNIVLPATSDTTFTGQYVVGAAASGPLTLDFAANVNNPTPQVVGGVGRTLAFTVQSAPLLNQASLTSVAIPSDKALNLTARATLSGSPVANTQTKVRVVVQNGGDAVAMDARVNLLILDSAGLNNTANFTISAQGAGTGEWRVGAPAFTDAVATSTTTSGVTSITVAAATPAKWTKDEWKDAMIRVTSGASASSQFLVLSNDLHQVNISGAPSPPLAAGNTFEIHRNMVTGTNSRTENSIPSGNPVLIVDNNKDWVVNQWRGYTVAIIDGTGKPAQGTVVANNAKNVTAIFTSTVSIDSTTRWAFFRPIYTHTVASFTGQTFTITLPAGVTWAGDQWRNTTVRFSSGGSTSESFVTANTANGVVTVVGNVPGVGTVVEFLPRYFKGHMDTADFTLTALQCPGGATTCPGTGQAADGRYNITAQVRFWDDNNFTGGSSGLNTQLRVASSAFGVFTMDSTEPVVSFPDGYSPPASPGLPGLQFQRGGANSVSFKAEITDNSVDAASQLQFVLLNASRTISVGGGSCVPAVAGQPLCPVLTATPTKSGNQFTITTDPSVFNELGNFQAYLMVTDRAGNRHNQTLGTWTILDTQPPAVSAGPTLSAPNNQAPLGSPIIFSATGSDNYQLSRMYIKAHHVQGGQDLFAGQCSVATPSCTALGGSFIHGRGLVLNPVGNLGFSQNGTWQGQVSTMPTSGTYYVKVLAEDSGGRLTEAGNVTLTVASGLALAFQGTGTPGFAAVPGGQITTAEAQNLRLDNLAFNAETFVFACTLLTPQTNATGAQGCKVANLTNTASFPQPENNTVNITLWECGIATCGAKGAPYTNVTGKSLGAVGSGTDKMHYIVGIAPPPSARPGEVVSIQLQARPLFATSGQNVTINVTLVAQQGTTFEFWNPTLPPTNTACFTTPAAGAAPFNCTALAKFNPKLTRSQAIDLSLRNPGNVETWYTFPTTSFVPVAGSPTRPAAPAQQWELTYSSTDSRWNSGNNSILLPPAGSPSPGNTTRVTMTVLVPANNAAGTYEQHGFWVERDSVTATGVGLSAYIEAFAPSISVTGLAIDGEFGPVTATTPPTPGTLCTSSGTLAPSCQWASNTYNKFTINATLSSTNNQPGRAGVIVAEAIITPTCGVSCVNSDIVVPFRATNPANEGLNGPYNATFFINQSLGIYDLRLRVTDVFPPGDQFVTLPATLTVREPNLPAGVAASATFPAVTGVTVLQDSTPIQRVAGKYNANFGSNITVQAVLQDNGEGNLGEARLLVQRQVGGTFVNVGEPLPMLRVTNTTVVSERVINATYQATFRPTGSFLEQSGLYNFDIQGFDAEDRALNNSALEPFFVDLGDHFGPTFNTARITSGTLGGDNLDIEQGRSANLTATITDNADGLPGSNVDLASPRVVVRSAAGAIVLNQSMVQVGTSTSWFREVAVSDINVTGTYTVNFSAKDKGGRENSVVRTLKVLVNQDPVLTVVSPDAASDGRRYAGTGGSVVVRAEDANLDNSTIAVTFNGNTSTFTLAAVSNGVTITIPVTGTGTLLVTVKDTLNGTATRSIDVGLDALAPVLTISVDALDVTTASTAGKAFSPTGVGGFFLSGQARVYVAASDAGSGMPTGTINVSVQKGTTTRSMLVSPDQRFKLSDVWGSVEEGAYTVNARGTDRAGNAGNAAAATFTVDNTPPSIGTVTPVSPLSIVVTDIGGSGVHSVAVTWGSSAAALTQTFKLTKGTGDIWAGDFPAAATGSVFFSVGATDNVGLTSEKRDGTQPFQLSFGNRAPLLTLRVQSNGTDVAAGGQVRGNVTVSWTVLDPEGAQVPVTVTVSGRAAPLASNATAVTSVVWDTGAERDGSYTITARGSDGVNENVTTFRVEVRNLQVTTPQPLPTNVAQGQSVLLAFAVSHAGSPTAVTVTLRLPGGGSETVQLRDDGTNGDKVARDGIWSTDYTPKAKGAYTADMQVTLQGGAKETRTGVATFDAQGSGGGLVGFNVMLVPVLALGAVVVVLGVFGLRRWR